MERALLWVLALAAVGGCLLALLREPEPATVAAPRDHTALEQRLSRIEEQIAALHRSLARPPAQVEAPSRRPEPAASPEDPVASPALRAAAPAAGQVEPSSPPPELWVSEVRDLLEEYRQALEEAAPNRHLHQLAMEKQEIQWREMEDLVLMQDLDNDQLTKKLRLLSAADVMRRFGNPTEIWVSPKHAKTFWGYNRDNGTPREFGFAFQDGFVVEAWAE